MKLAIITGASAGIGTQTAAQFSKQGYSTVNLSRGSCNVDGVINISCDLSIPSSISQACAEIDKLLSQSQTTALVHNACQMRKDSTDNCSSDDLRNVFETNIIAANSLNQHIIPTMKPSSSIIYVGSTLSEKAVANSFSYVTSKHALIGMMRATCQDLQGRSIHTAAVCPGFTDTEMLRQHLGNDAQVLQQVAGLNGFNRLVNPEEIAAFILWSHNNPVINGSVLHAHLGQIES
jgi:3-oxoacyl-[acyl-carrier protein] reductase